MHAKFVPLTKKQKSEKTLKPIKNFITYIHHLYIFQSRSQYCKLNRWKITFHWEWERVRVSEMVGKGNMSKLFAGIQLIASMWCNIRSITRCLFFPLSLSHISNRFFASADRTWCLFLFSVFNLSDEKVNDWPI